MKIVKHLNIDGINAKENPSITGEGAPTTATAGAVGCLYMDTLTGELYKCTAVVSGVYTWVAVGGGNGGSGVNIVQTTGNSETAVMSQKAVTSALGGCITLIKTVEDTLINYSGVPVSEPGLYYNEYSVGDGFNNVEIDIYTHAVESMKMVAYGENDEILYIKTPPINDITVLQHIPFIIPEGTKKLRICDTAAYRADFKLNVSNIARNFETKIKNSNEILGSYFNFVEDLSDCYVNENCEIVREIGLYIRKYNVRADGLKVSVFRHASSTMGITCFGEDESVLLFVGGNNDLTNGGWNIFTVPEGTRKILISNLTSKQNDYQIKVESLLDFVNRVSEKGVGKLKIVNMGDSIFGNYNDETSISNQLASLTGAEVYNCAFGGCQMTLHRGEEWTPFSMCSLADAIATGDFSSQTEKASAGVSGIPSYFINHVNTLKAIDFSEIDIITIAYGTNDFADDDLIETTEGDEYNKTTLKGALRYSIETIGRAFPNIRFLVCTPMWRCWFDNGEFLYDSDTYKPWSNYLIEYVNGIKDVANEYHLPVCDFYNEIGLNKFCWQVFFDNTDGTHPNARGREIMAAFIAKKLF